MKEGNSMEYKDKEMKNVAICKRKEIFLNREHKVIYKTLDIKQGIKDEDGNWQIDEEQDYFQKISDQGEEIVCINIGGECQDIPSLWKKFENKYFYITDDNTGYTFIKNSKDINACKLAFSDMEEKPISKIGSISANYYYLKEIIYGQDEALKILLARIQHYQKRIRSTSQLFDSDELAECKPNILLIGSTGVGKTLIIKQIAKLFSLPYCIEDATSYSETAYKGGDVTDMLKHLYKQSEEELTVAQEGILFIDEVDKICQKKESSVNTTGVQQGLLKILEGSNIYLSKTNTDNIGNFYFDTSKLTIILSGAFDGLLSNQKLEITNEDLEEYGMISEMAGRISTKITLNRPTKESLKNAFLNSKLSPYLITQKELAEDNIQIQLEDGFVDSFIDKVYSLNTGYRALKQVFNQIVDEQLYDIESGKQKVLYLTKEKLK